MNKTSHTHKVTVIMSLLKLNCVMVDFKCFAEINSDSYNC